MSAAVGVVLAAGEARRFGSPKQVAELAGRPLLAHAVEAVRAVLPEVVVVLGAHAEAVRARVPLGDARVVVCAEWDRGLSASLRAGLEAAPGAGAYVIALGDEPGVTPEVVARIAAHPGTCRAAYGGRPGHPVRLARADASRALRLTGDEGARSLLRDAPLVECGDLADPRDVDTPSDLEAMRS